MSADEAVVDTSHRTPVFQFDRHAPDYRDNFSEITGEMHSKCPVAWSDTHGGHWVAAGGEAVFAPARSADTSNDHDVKGIRRGHKGFMIPIAVRASGIRGGILEMDDPEHREFRAVLNPYLSAHPGPGLIDDVTFETVAVNLTGPLLCTRAVVPYMKERGYGKIANQSSSGAFMAARPTPTAARRSRCTNSRATPRRPRTTFMPRRQRSS